MWRKVQVERPRAATSGGQSEGSWSGVWVVVGGGGGGGEVVVVVALLMASQEATEVQERQLFIFNSF